MCTFCPKGRNLSLSAALSIHLFTISIRHLPPSAMWGNLFPMYTEYDMANPHSDFGNSPRSTLILVTIVRFVRSATALVWLWYATVGLVSISFYLSHDVRFLERYYPPKSHRRLTALDPDMASNSKSVMSSCRFCSTSDLLQIARAMTNLSCHSMSVTIVSSCSGSSTLWSLPTAPREARYDQCSHEAYALHCGCSYVSGKDWSSTSGDNFDTWLWVLYVAEIISDMHCGTAVHPPSFHIRIVTCSVEAISP